MDKVYDICCGIDVHKKTHGHMLKERQQEYGP